MSETQNDINTLIARLTERQQMEFALRCARRVQHLMRDPRSIAVLEVRERWLRGEVSDKEMEKAAEAALAAGWAAAGAAAWARQAAETAGRAAAYDAECAWQRGELERMLQGASDE